MKAKPKGAKGRTTAERREAVLARFRAELHRDPTEDEELLLRTTGGIPNPLGMTHQPRDPLGFIIKILKAAERRAAQSKRAKGDE